MDDSAKEIEVPSFFVCPISLEIMKDPVTLSTGITYDREPIEKWLCTNKNVSCPITKQPVIDVELTPNHTLRRLIQSWCTHNASFGVERIPTPRLPVSKSQILKLLQDSKSPNLRMKSLKKLKEIVLESDMNKRSMEAVGAADYLAYIISKSSFNMTSLSPATEVSGVADGFDNNLLTAFDEVVSILYHIHLSQTELKALFGITGGEFADALVCVMQRATSFESRIYAVLLLKSMIEVAEPNQMMSLKPGFFTGLTQILVNQISQKATRAALKLLIRVCPWGRNRIKVVAAGTVSVLIDTLLDCSEKRISKMVLMVLDQLCLCADGRAELLKHGVGLAVVYKRICRVSPVASGRAVRILHSVAKFSGTSSVVQEMFHLGVVGKLCFLLQVDCESKTKEKAREILKMNARVWKNSSCIPYNLVSSYPS